MASSLGYSALFQREERYIIAETVTPRHAGHLKSWAEMSDTQALKSCFGLLKSLTIKLGGKTQELRFMPQEPAVRKYTMTYEKQENILTKWEMDTSILPVGEEWDFIAHDKNGGEVTPQFDNFNGRWYLYPRYPSAFRDIPPHRFPLQCTWKERRIKETRVNLESGDILKGFQCRVLVDPETGGEFYFDTSAVIWRPGWFPWSGTVRLEPLCGAIAFGARFPGKLRCLPDTLKLDKVQEAPDVNQLHVVHGTTRDHIIHLGKKPFMFWAEMIGMVCCFYYLDVGLDIKQMFVFSSAGLYVYLVGNSIGIAVSALTSIRDVYSFFCDPSAKTVERDGVMKLMSPGKAAAIGIMLVVTQTHMLVLTCISCHYRKAHPLFKDFKTGEFIEAAISALVQLDCMSSFICKINSVASLIPHSGIESMAFSIATSIGCLGLGLASRDRSDTKVCGLQGRLKGWPVQLFVLIAVRALEATSRLLSVVLLHLGTRGPAFKYTFGPFCAFYILLAWMLFSRYGSASDVCTALIGHPGQILERSSLLPLRRSLLLHSFLVLAAGAAQYSAWCSSESSPSYMNAYSHLAEHITATYLSKGEKSLLKGENLTATYLPGVANITATYLGKGENITAPYLSKGQNITATYLPRMDGGNITSDLQATLGNITAELLAMADHNGYNITALMDHEAAKKIMDRAGILQIYKQHYSDGKAVPYVLLRLWLVSTLASILGLLAFNAYARCCSQHHPAFSEAKKKMDDSSWCVELSQMVSLPGLFPVSPGVWSALSSSGMDVLVDSSATQTIEQLDKDLRGKGIQCPLRLGLRRATPEQVKPVQYLDPSWCFLKAMNANECDHLQEVVRAVKKHQHVVEELCFRSSVGGPGWMGGLDAERPWEKLFEEWEGCQFPNLKIADFKGNFKMSSDGAEQVVGAVSTSKLLESVDFSTYDDDGDPYANGGIPEKAWKRWQGCTFPNLKKANFKDLFEKQSTGAAEVLGAVGTSNRLEHVNLSGCKKIPEQAWKCWQASRFPNLKIASFKHCFIESGAGAEHALSAVSCASKVLEGADFGGCGKIPEEAWSRWRGITFPNLKEAWFSGCEAGAKHIYGAISASELLEKIQLSPAPDEAWKCLQGATFPNLKKAYLNSCFPKSGEGAIPKSGEGAEHVFGALSDSKLLEFVDFSLNGFSEKACMRWKGTTFPKLKSANFFGSLLPGEAAAYVFEAVSASQRLEEVDFYPCRDIPEQTWKCWQNSICPKGAPKSVEEACRAYRSKQPLQEPAEDEDGNAIVQVPYLGEAVEMIVGSSKACLSDGGVNECIPGSLPNLKEADFQACFGRYETGLYQDKSCPGTEQIVRLIATSKNIESINFYGCSEIPGKAWQQWRGCSFPKLKTCNFSKCFQYSAHGCQYVFKAVSTSKVSEKIIWGKCDALPQEYQDEEKKNRKKTLINQKEDKLKEQKAKLKQISREDPWGDAQIDAWVDRKRAAEKEVRATEEEIQRLHITPYQQI